jgi:hypothetical protein
MNVKKTIKKIISDTDSEDSVGSQYNIDYSERVDITNRTPTEYEQLWHQKMRKRPK